MLNLLLGGKVEKLPDHHISTVLKEEERAAKELPMPQAAISSTVLRLLLLTAAPRADCMHASPAAVEAWRAYQASILRTATAFKPPAGVVSPPSHFDRLEIGPYELSVSRADSLDGSEIAFGVQRLATRPALFHLRGFLSSAECDHIVAAAAARTMASAKTAGGAARSGCDVAWLPIESDPVCLELSGVVAELLLRPEVRDPTGWGEHAAFEKLQVLRYREGGEFKLYHDANLETPRIRTVLLYLNGKGETWFPGPARRGGRRRHCRRLQPAVPVGRPQGLPRAHTGA